MKKSFVEPSIRRIELNLRENIAESEQETDEGGIHFMAHYSRCTIQNTNYTIHDPLPNMLAIMGCLSNLDGATNRGTVVPESVFRMQKGL